MALELSTIGNRLKAARANCGRTQDNAAKELSISRAAVIAIENGERPLTLEELNAFARLYTRPVAEFLEERPEDVLVALLRATPELQDGEQAEGAIMRHLAICRAGADLERLLGMTMRPVPPAYDLPAPTNVAEALEQGNLVARQERQRLGLGDNPIPDMADLLTTTGVWASGSRLPEEMSGLFLRHPTIGMVVLVNFNHGRARKRFSYAHEYGHALLDRSDTATVSTQRNRTELREVRANAFAAAFLLPAGGVRRFLASRGKGMQSRMETVVYDPGIEAQDEPVRATHRPVPGSQKISYRDVSTLAHMFGTSYQAAAYRMKSHGAINEKELKECLDKKEVGWKYLKALGLYEDIEGVEEKKKADRELVTQIVDLAIEAHRRNQLTTDRLLELGATLELGGRKLVELAEAAL
jgi:Zn-dependent peptidase ImmA (M78 family)/DNA-binding XRE family transcriptional regulator